jgi:hypothetical protein
MSKALISPGESVRRITGWQVVENKYEPIIGIIENGARIAGMDIQEHEVCPPLFWKDCSDDMDQEKWYYDLVQEQFFEIGGIPKPITPSSGELPGVTL